MKDSRKECLVKKPKPKKRIILSRSLIGVGLLILVYIAIIEPRWPEITHLSLTHGEAKRTIKIAHLTDLHTHGLGYIERQMFASLDAEKPDAIVITGDMATPGGTEMGYASVLKNLKAPMGVYFVKGNHDHWHPIPNKEELFTQFQITDLTNDRKEITPGVTLFGFDDEVTGKPELNILDQVFESSFNIALFHSPSFVSKVAGRVHLALAGHTHGGQIVLPFYGPLWLPKGTGKYIAGLYQEKKTKLYVSRGLGNSIFPIRMNCRPEITYFTIKY